MYLGSWNIDDYLTFPANTHTPATGAATDADAVPSYRIYEDETGTAILTGSLAKLDDAGTTGFYSERIQLTAANGFEIGKTYTIYVSATVGAIVGTLSHTFQVRAKTAALVWDEVLTGATHNVPASAGRRLRTIPSTLIWEETAQGPGANDNQIQFDTGASAVDGAYDPALVAIINGTGAGQSRLILEYVGSTKIATVDRDWKVKPDDTSEFVIYANPGREHINEGLAQAATSLTITLNALASATDEEYTGQLIFIRSGLGQDQVRMIKSYVGSSKVATIYAAWGVTPDTTSAYVMLPNATNPDLATGLAVALAALVAIQGAGFVTGTDSLEAVRNAIDAAVLALGGATFATGTDSLEAIRDRGDVAWITADTAGAGAITWTYNVTDTGTTLPISDVDVWVTTDISGVNVIASGKTDAFGNVVFQLDAGTYYIWSQKAGYNFTNPDTEIVS